MTGIPVLTRRIKRKGVDFEARRRYLFGDVANISNWKWKWLAVRLGLKDFEAECGAPIKWRIPVLGSLPSS